MARTAATTPEQIRATILTMLAESHEQQPASRARFRRVVSVRKLRERLGAGDPATLGRAINAIEAEVVRSGLAEIAIPELPAEIAEQMRQLWQAAVSVQLDEVLQLKAAAQRTADAAQMALVEANLRVDVLKQELAELRAAAVHGDTELAQLRAAHAVLSTQHEDMLASEQARDTRLQAAENRAAELEQTHAAALTAERHRYEGLSKQLLLETAQQRQALQSEAGRLASQLKFSERRVATLEESLARTGAEVATEREKRQNAAGEASALKAVNTSQRAQLDELLRAALAPPSAAKQRAPRDTGRVKAPDATQRQPARRKSHP